MQFVSWLSGHSDDAWLRRMSVLSMRSSSAGMNPTITLDELQDRCNFHQRRMLMPGGRLIRTFLKDRVARIGSSVMLSGPLPAGEAANCVAVREDPRRLRISQCVAWEPVGRLAALARRGWPMSSRSPPRAIWLTPKFQSAGTCHR
jgi:hypothetical protein